MKRLSLFILLVSLSLSPVFATGAIAAQGSHFSIVLINRTARQVEIVLVGTGNPQEYRWSVAPGEEGRFAVQAGRYAHTTSACGKTATGTLDVTRGLRLIFTRCPGTAPHAGEPSIEKIHLSDSPSGHRWSYRYAPARSKSVGSGAGACLYTATEDVTIYTRPDTSAAVFSEQGAGFSIQPGARTLDGWLGFDPGVAQAANIGPFRLRWLSPGSGTTTGGCSSLPVVWAPLPGICYDMPMFDTNIYASPDTSAAVLFVLHLGEFAAVLGTTADGNWAQVDLGPGNTGSNAVGWVEAGTLNVNGPCASLPTVSP